MIIRTYDPTSTKGQTGKHSYSEFNIQHFAWLTNCLPLNHKDNGGDPKGIVLSSAVTSGLGVDMLLEELEW